MLLRLMSKHPLCPRNWEGRGRGGCYLLNEGGGVVNRDAMRVTLSRPLRKVFKFLSNRAGLSPIPNGFTDCSCFRKRRQIWELQHISLYYNKRHESMKNRDLSMSMYGLKQISGILRNDRLGVVERLQTFAISSNFKAVSLLLEKSFPKAGFH